MIPDMMKRIFMPLVLCVALFVSCKTEQIPENIIGEDLMVTILTEIHMVDAYIVIEYDNEENAKEYLQNKVYPEIFERNGVTADDFYQSVDYYSDRPKAFRSIYEKVILQLDKK
jgi:hypothetical protein